MRYYKCEHRGRGVIELKARHAFEAQQQAAKLWDVPIRHVTVELNDVTPAGYAV